MIRLYLPFNMRFDPNIDPDTYDGLFDHPILDIGSSSASLQYPIRSWLQDAGRKWAFGFDGQKGEYYLEFSSEEDRTMFLLRWL